MLWLNHLTPISLHQRVEEGTPSPTSPSARRTSVSTATRRTTPRRTSCGCRASPAATCTLSPPSPWTPSPGRTSPLPSSHGNSWSSGRSWGRGSSERWAGLKGFWKQTEGWMWFILMLESSRVWSGFPPAGPPVWGWRTPRIPWGGVAPPWQRRPLCAGGC